MSNKLLKLIYCSKSLPSSRSSSWSPSVRAKVDLSWKPEEKADGTEPIIIIEDWYKEQTICGEEYVHVCCSQFNQTEPECKSYDVKNLCKDNSEVYGGVKPEEQLVVAQERVNKIIVAISFEEVQLDLDKELLDFRLYL